MQQGMEYVYAVWQAGSFSGAAAKLYLSQPALSIAVRKVEEALGTPLFDRSTQPLSLTPAGELYIHAAQRIRSEEAALQRGLQDMDALVSGTLRIGGPTLYTTYLLPPVLAQFMEQYPGVTIELNEYFAGEQRQYLEDGAVDMIINCQNLDPAVFEMRELLRERILLAVPEEHPLNRRLAGSALSRADIVTGRHLQAGCPRVDTALFREEEFLTPGPGNTLTAYAEEICTGAGFAPRSRLVLNQAVTAYRMAARGLGVTFTADTLICGDVSEGLCYYLPASPLVERPVRLVTLRGRYLPRAGQEFCRMALAYFAAQRQG